MDCENPSLRTRPASRFPAENHPARPARHHRERPREHPRIRGVNHQRTPHTSHFSVVGHHFAQHSELSGTAKGIGLYILSVAPGTPVDIKSLAARLPEGQTRIAAALRELETHGYLRRVRERTEKGHMVTHTWFIHRPGAVDVPPPHIPQQRQSPGPHDMPTARPVPSAPEVPGVAPRCEDPEDLWASWGLWNDWDSHDPWDLSPPPIPTPTGDCPAPTDSTHTATSAATTADPAPAIPTTNAPATDTPTAPPVNTPRPPKRPLPPVPQPSQPSPELLRTAADLLAGLRRHNPQMHLSTHDVEHLAPGVAAWLEREVTPAAVRTALTCGLPFPVLCPPALVAYRLIDQLPPPLPPLPPQTAEPPLPPAPVRHPLRNCDGCDRGFRSPDPDALCRECTEERARGTHGTERTTQQTAYT